jgi:hypothetical protein
MNIALILSSVALGISLLASAFKFFEWLIHTNPRNLIQTGRLLLLSLAVASIPSLIGLVSISNGLWRRALARSC